MSNDKIKQFSNKFDVLHSRENNSWIGGEQYLTSMLPGGFGQEGVLKSVSSTATWEQGMIG